MVEQLLPGLYRIEVPLPRNPLKMLNSYVVKGKDRFLVIDTGMNRDECRTAMESGLAELGVDLDKTDFFITHLHADHSGLVGTLIRDNSAVYFTELEAGIVGRTTRMSDFYFDFYHDCGFPEAELTAAIEAHPGKRFGLKREIAFRFVNDGDSIDIGGYSFRCVITPGHTPSHMCLYEAKQKILVAGDHILFDITPNIAYWPELDNSLKRYMESLDKVFSLDVNLVLPGHRSLLNNHRERIRELQEHHRSRLKEVLAALRDGEKNVWQTAPLVKWDIDCARWDDFPAPQKWFAFSETLAHLIYLEQEGKIRRNRRDGKITFSLV